MEVNNPDKLHFGQRFWLIIAFFSLIIGIFLGNVFTWKRHSDDQRSLDAKSWTDSSKTKDSHEDSSALRK